MPGTVVIVGRPNVGKSTLFNRLAGRRLALVHDQPGVTRDRRQAEAAIANLEFDIIDTAGFEEATGESLEARMRQQTEQAIAAGDVCLLLVDARAGLTTVDRQFAEIVRRSGKPVIVCANKAEGRAGQSGLYEAFELGLGEPIAISAAHGEGMDELYEALKAKLPAPGEGVADEEADSRPIRLAIIGRPNVGKSTLINALVGEERMLTGPEAGITRDAIAMDWSWRDRPIKVWDTAGMRKRARIDEPLEKMAVQDGLRAIKFAEVIVLVLDAGNPFEKQDLQLADLIEREGRALVIAVNKWDLVVEERTRRLKELQADLKQMLPQLAGVPLVTVSAVEGKGLGRMMEAVFDVYELWNKRVGTGELNRWLEYQIERHPPPAPGGRRIKLRYMTQVSARPPSFAVFSTRGSELPEAYKRYLVNGLRADFGLKGIPIRLNLRERKNPYAPE
ncbi:MAG TPA: ribosome biogenesis GTPase Der [Aestuariivirgaceae bacterium]|nr:ribosome biogenesis GTPase Der [Aestuariivirgaceae bacterium]